MKNSSNNDNQVIFVILAIIFSCFLLYLFSTYPSLISLAACGVVYLIFAFIARIFSPSPKPKIDAERVIDAFSGENFKETQQAINQFASTEEGREQLDSIVNSELQKHSENGRQTLLEILNKGINDNHLKLMEQNEVIMNAILAILYRILLLLENKRGMS